MNQEAKSAALTLNSDTQSVAAATKAQAALTLEAMRNSGTYVGNEWVPAYSSEDLQAFAAQAQRRSTSSMESANRSGADRLAIALEKAQATAKSAEGLQELLNARPMPGESQLNATGTNLFVRNYGSTNAPVVDLLAKQGKLLVPLPATARALSLGKQKPSPKVWHSVKSTTTVTGLLLNRQTKN